MFDRWQTYDISQSVSGNKARVITVRILIIDTGRPKEHILGKSASDCHEMSFALRTALMWFSSRFVRGCAGMLKFGKRTVARFISFGEIFESMLLFASFRELSVGCCRWLRIQRIVVIKRSGAVIVMTGLVVGRWVAIFSFENGRRSWMHASHDSTNCQSSTRNQYIHFGKTCRRGPIQIALTVRRYIICRDARPYKQLKLSKLTQNWY